MYKNLKWCIINNMGKRSLETITTFNSKEDALREADIEWNSLTKSDQKNTDSYIVGLCNVEEYEPGCWQYTEDESGNIDADIYEVAKVYK